jgi:hypothetical protein
MGFSLTNEDHMVVCNKDIKERKTTDHTLAPPISKFPTMFKQRKSANQHWTKKRESSNEKS